MEDNLNKGSWEDHKPPITWQEVTLERVKAAYEKIGMMPAVYASFPKPHKSCGCPLQALALAEGWLTWGSVLSDNEKWPFVEGFDRGLTQTDIQCRGNDIAVALGIREFKAYES